MIKTAIWLTLGVSISIYCLVLVALYLFQEKLIFPGQALAEGYTFSFDEPFEEVNVEVEGATLNALHFKQPNTRGLVFFLHGNGGNLQNWTIGVDFYQRVNYDLFIFDYRGYGKSSGKIQSEKQLHQDVYRAWLHIAEQYKNLPIVIYGRSLGTALAVELAQHVPHAKLVLVSPFTRMDAMVKQHYPYAPSFLLRYPLVSDEKISQINSEIIFFHGDQDNFIPLSHSQELQKRVQTNSKLIIVNGASHNDVHEFNQYLDSFADVLP